MKPALFSSVVLSCGLIMAPIVSACVDAQRMTAPSAMVSPPVVASAPTPAPPVTVAPLPPVAAEPLPPAPVPVVPIGPHDCDFSQLGAIRCYNKNAIAQTLTAALNTISCDKSFAVQTVTIAPNTNGYFTLGGLGCGERGQVDMFRSDREGDCRNPDFAAGRVYDGGVCPPPPPLPPPPPCVGKQNFQIHPGPEPPRCQ